MKLFFIALSIISLFSFSAFSQDGWVIQNSGTTNNLNSIYFFNANTGMACGSNGTICRTTNGGVQWTALTVQTVLNVTLNSIFVTDGLTARAVGYKTDLSANDGVIFTTSDGGLTWTSITYSSGNDIYYNSISFSDVYHGFIAGYTFNNSNNQINAIVLRTTNAGNPWIDVSPSANTILRSVFFSDMNSGFAVGNAGNIFKTVDGGNSWQTLSVGITTPFNSVYKASNNDVSIVGDYGKIYLSSNNGENWTNASLSFPGNSISIKSIFFVPGYKDLGFQACQVGIVRRTTDGGLTWANLVSGIPNYTNLSSIFFVDSTTGYTCGQNGTILKTTTSGITFVNQNGSEIPSQFLLHQNYPNPFNPVTKIMFDIPKGNNQSLTKLAIYDASGKEVSVLVNQILNPGTYSVDWNAMNNPSGVYFYTLTSGDLRQTKKLVLLK